MAKIDAQGRATDVNDPALNPVQEDEQSGEHPQRDGNATLIDPGTSEPEVGAGERDQPDDATGPDKSTAAKRSGARK